MGKENRYLAAGNEYETIPPTYVPTLTPSTNSPSATAHPTTTGTGSPVGTFSPTSGVTSGTTPSPTTFSTIGTTSEQTSAAVSSAGINPLITYGFPLATGLMLTPQGQEMLQNFSAAVFDGAVNASSYAVNSISDILSSGPKSPLDQAQNKTNGTGLNQ